MDVPKSVFSVTTKRNRENVEGWTSRDHYFDVKRKRLEEQFEKERTLDKPQIFKVMTKDVRIYVDGRTNPSMLELKELMAQHGGGFEQFVGPSVTHIICVNLAEATLKRLQTMMNPPNVVNPKWITDSIRSSCLLSLKDYLVVDRKNTNRPAFKSNDLGEFQKNSRLHLIGAYRKRHDHSDTLDEEVDEHVRKFIVHLDMDCFFASVAMRDDPSLVDKPIAVAHSSTGNSEISSANYVARSYGIKAGMWMTTAREKCPNLIVLPYEMDEYERTAQRMNNILFEMCEKKHVRIMSIDEAYIDLTTQCNNDHRTAIHIVTNMRNNIREATGCTCSAGISHNMLLARMATKHAKPNGQYYLDDVEHIVTNFIKDQKISLLEIPGIGRKTFVKIQERFGQHITTASDLWTLSMHQLTQLLGSKNGESIYYNCRGIPTATPRATFCAKSIGVEMNWGIRFSTQDQVNVFLIDLSKQVSTRLKSQSSKTKSITVKVKARKQGAPIEPIKYMGHGPCDNASKSIVCDATDDSTLIGKHAVHLYQQLNVVTTDLRGIGIQVTKLIKASSSTTYATSLSQYFTRNTVSDVSGGDDGEVVQQEEQQEVEDDPFEGITEQEIEELFADINNQQVQVQRPTTPPPPQQHDITYSQIDKNVLHDLPKHIQDEILGDCGQKKKKPVLTIKRKVNKKNVDVKTTNVDIQQMFVKIADSNKQEQDEMNNIKNGVYSLDYSVVRQLPKSIQKEIVKNKVAERKDRDLAIKIQQQQVPTPNETVLPHSDTFFPCLRDNVYQVCFCVCEWMSQVTDAPDESEQVFLEMVLQWFQQVVCQEKNLEAAVKLLRYMKKMCDQNPSCESIFNKVNHVVCTNILPMSGVCDQNCTINIDGI
ncbi:DNA repair protein REV1 [Acrasis kona]|uniref:DNA repair protein REV1 n=1 Tax=Acrasis kona TaxID=1008807 RepID=A0AAW2Z868_9EUKA